MSRPLLVGYWRSSAAYRLRIAANLKAIAYDQLAVHLRFGQQREPAHLARHPGGLVPLWQEGEVTLAQSLAIIEYLDETHPEPPLLPADPLGRAYAREIALMMVADIHPIGNLRVLDKLTADYGADAEARSAWNRHWIGHGLAAVEARLDQTAGRFAVGDRISIADICLVPQVYNARRFGLDLSSFPTIVRLDAEARGLAAVAAAAPEVQPDAE